jgi:hypothetical protein
MARRRRSLVLAIVALAIGVLVVVYRGPGRALVRGHLGDVAATMLVHAVLGLAWRARLRTRALVTFAIASAVELGQIVWHASSTAGALVFGTTFDPWDLVAYAFGVAIAVGWERARCPITSSTRRAPRSHPRSRPGRRRPGRGRGRPSPG